MPDPERAAAPERTGAGEQSGWLAAGVDTNDSATFAVGDRVRCERATPGRGSWSRFAGREGAVVSVNVARSVNGSPDVVEVGVDLDSDGRADASFRTDELVVIGTPQATSVRLLAANGEVG